MPWYKWQKDRWYLYWRSIKHDRKNLWTLYIIQEPAQWWNCQYPLPVPQAGISFQGLNEKIRSIPKMNTLLLGLYYLYKKSPKQKKMLEKAFESQGKRVNLPRRVGGIRWVSHLYEAINIFIGSYPVFMDQLDTASHINSKAEGLAKLGRSLNVLHFILILREFIVPLKRLSLSLQKRDQALSDTIVTIKATMDVLPIMLDDINQDAAGVMETKMYKGVTLTQKGQPPSPDLRRGVADTLLACIEKRFPDISDNDVLKATGLTMLSSWPLESQMRGFGELHVRNAYQHFRESLLTLVFKGVREKSSLSSGWCGQHSTICMGIHYRRPHGLRCTRIYPGKKDMTIYWS